MPYVTGAGAVSLQLTGVLLKFDARRRVRHRHSRHLHRAERRGREVSAVPPLRSARARRWTSAGTSPLIVAGDAASTRLDEWFSDVELGAKGSAAGAFEVEIEAAIDKMRLVLDVGEGDGFLQKVLGDNPQTVELNPGFALSNTRGFRFMGKLRLEIEISVHLDIGGVIFIGPIGNIQIGAGSSGKVETVLAVTGGLALGPSRGQRQAHGDRGRREGSRQPEPRQPRPGRPRSGSSSPRASALRSMPRSSPAAATSSTRTMSTTASSRCPSLTTSRSRSSGC